MGPLIDPFFIPPDPPENLDPPDQPSTSNASSSRGRTASRTQFAFGNFVEPESWEVLQKENFQNGMFTSLGNFVVVQNFYFIFKRLIFNTILRP